MLAAVLFLVSIFMFEQELNFLFEQDTKPIVRVSESFHKGELQHPELVQIRGFVAGYYGWELPPQTSGSLRYKSPFTVGPEQAVFVGPVFYKASAHIENALSISIDQGKTFSLIAKNSIFLTKVIDITPYLPTGGIFEILFEATNSGSSSVLVLDKVTLSLFDHQPPPPPSPLSMTLAFLSLGCAIVLLTRKWRQTLPVLLILSIGFFVRFWCLEAVMYDDLDPDAQDYRSLAERLTLFGENGFYSGNFGTREPVFLLAAKVFFLLFGPSDNHLRYVSLFFSLVVVLLTYWLARELFGYRLGLLAAFAMAVNVPLVRESSRGLRLELEMVFLLCFCYIGFVKQGVKPVLRFLLMGFLGGLTVLTRSAYFPGLALLVLAAAVARGWKLKQILLMSFLAVFFMGALLAPHQYGMHSLHGDSLWSARGYFEHHLDQPLLETALGSVRGVYKIVTHMDMTSGRWNELDVLFKGLGVLGLLFAVSVSMYRWLPVAFFFSILAVPYLYDRGLLEVYRHTMQAFPFFLLSALLFFDRTLVWTKRIVRNALSSRWKTRGKPASLNRRMPD